MYIHIRSQHLTCCIYMHVEKFKEEKMISRKIKEILQTKKWRQKRLAQHLGVSPSRLCYWYHGMTEPKEDWIVQEINKLYEECIKEKERNERNKIY